MYSSVVRFCSLTFAELLTDAVHVIGIPLSSSFNELVICISSKEELIIIVLYNNYDDNE